LIPVPDDTGNDTRDDIKRHVRRRYAGAARAAVPSCCAPGGDAGCCCSDGDKVARVRELYGKAAAPQAAFLGSLGCGSPVAAAGLAAGETVLDLGCGGGLDLVLAAREVGPRGRVYGLDMTEEMLALARRNLDRAKVDNAVLLLGDMEAIPLPAASCDVVISNCVINLAPDKGRVLAEAHRVLRPGGRLAVSDIVLTGELPAVVAADRDAWSGCIAGALEVGRYRDLLAEAGFADITVEPTGRFDADSAGGDWWGRLDRGEQAEVRGIVNAATVRARRP